MANLRPTHRFLLTITTLIGLTMSEFSLPAANYDETKVPKYELPDPLTMRDGTRITTTMALHLGSVCRQAQWPAVTCMNIYTDLLVNEAMPLVNGTLKAPDRPGLGVTFNEAALKWRVETHEKPNVEAVYAIVRENGTRTWYEGEYGPKGFWEACRAGNEALDEGGVALQRWDRDGSSGWEDMAHRVAIAPVREGKMV